MKNKFLLKSIGYILALMIMLQSVPCAFAHNTSQEGKLAKYYLNNSFYKGKWFIGGEDVGWSIDENYHTNGSNIYYTLSKDDDYVAGYKKIITEAAGKWKNLVLIKEGSGSGSGTISTYSDSTSEIAAQACHLKSDSSGHFTSWEIQINRAHTITSASLAHEFGHIIGLNDLYEYYNSNKLMYGREGRTVTAPTSLDIWGAKIIIGQHTTHTWAYKYYSYSGNTTYHITYCTDCNGYRASSDKITPIITSCTYTYKYYSPSGQGINRHLRTCQTCGYSSVVNCTYNSKNVCTYCGIPKGYSPYSINQEPQ